MLTFCLFCLVFGLHLEVFGFFLCKFSFLLFITVEKEGEEHLAFVLPLWFLFPIYVKMHVSISVRQLHATKIGTLS